MARNLMRSRSGVRGSMASWRTRRLKSSQERSRLKKEEVLGGIWVGARTRVVTAPPPPLPLEAAVPPAPVARERLGESRGSGGGGDMMRLLRRGVGLDILVFGQLDCRA